MPDICRLATAALLRKHGAKPTPQSAAELDRAQFGSEDEAGGSDEEADGSDEEGSGSDEVAGGSEGGSDEGPASEAGSDGGEEDAAAQLDDKGRMTREPAADGSVAEESNTIPARSQVCAA